MFALVSTAVLNTLQMTGTAPIALWSTWDATARKAPTSVPTGFPLPPPLPSTLPHPVSFQPRLNAGHANSASATTQPPLPPISFPSLPSVVEDDIMNFSFDEDEAHEAASPQPGNYLDLYMTWTLGTTIVHPFVVAHKIAKEKWQAKLDLTNAEGCQCILEKPKLEGIEALIPRPVVPEDNNDADEANAAAVSCEGSEVND
ncbi:hypothetical protein P691DRAFT_781943 [Macrolepiota fuliginosa MF-IS2]|uniref:Uncharacterized protein n=1 Tax=Macrolepiota fuliginosa MF-IS2 TaxID=1400762 RepID=A0A9P5WZH3_9AGAR|nr:hypothetical protein P691DRAFT_781943 [Macrolepiota fuliginosa MF-IS2]